MGAWWNQVDTEVLDAFGCNDRTDSNSVAPTKYVAVWWNWYTHLPKKQAPKWA